MCVCVYVFKSHATGDPRVRDWGHNYLCAVLAELARVSHCGHSWKSAQLLYPCHALLGALRFFILFKPPHSRTRTAVINSINRTIASSSGNYPSQHSKDIGDGGDVSSQHSGLVVQHPVD
jgi:hypothetical protein